MHIDLGGRTALVTGGSEGLGLAIASRLARSGARVGILARRPDVLAKAVERLSKETPGAIFGHPCDVTDESALHSAVEATVDAIGPIDILVNNAGSSSRGAFPDLSRKSLLDDYNLKVVAAIVLSQLVLPHMQEQRWGRIINIVSINAKAPKAESAPTTLSRAAGITLSKVMSQELAPWNVLVNALCIGTIKSGQWERRHRQNAPDDVPYEEYLAPFAKAVPLGRLGEAEELANVACFLASDAASYITGAAINVDGGLSPVP
ncbi:NAD(P)-dependent dehydrogenase (short-subunit alcohol dehydrogenase family) [Mycoplana sp. BE70]|uniref:SDR family NAD(P)-dependent oxidoreductase n=1 Tax=Mycoplana sp. BE70 TaxID=2817775 RepID=UPI00285A873F|nr:SDR family oxidoreductase [Mycoplana sp. BE70]MDR6756425.1 NAD(P)-dependent dehydrogenase (short-subunit alcohol dehydrogenase family) [Mycoplana sp. BE70]